MEWGVIRKTGANTDQSRHHPRKRMIQYSRDLRIDRKAAAYWIARSSRAMTADAG
jgi:hypothetical protein